MQTTLKVRGKFLRHRLENGTYSDIVGTTTHDEQILMATIAIEQIENVLPDGHESLCIFKLNDIAFGVTLTWWEGYGWDTDDDAEYELKQVIETTRIEYIYG